MATAAAALLERPMMIPYRETGPNGIHKQRHLKTKMTLKAESWARTQWMYRKKVLKVRGLP